MASRPDRTLNGRHLARLLGAWRTRDAAYLALSEAIRLLVLDGRLPLHTRLPGERELADATGVSRTTVTAAYRRLKDQGYLRSRPASGSWTSLPADRKAGPSAAFGIPSAETGDVIDLLLACPSAPEGIMHRVAEDALDALPKYLPGHGYERLGIAEMREVVAARYQARGVPTLPDEVMITHGAQHAFALALRLLAGPGDRVLVEHPTYPNALEAIVRAGARPVPLPFGPGGWDLDMLAATLRGAAPRLGYLIIDFHNPTGRLMDESTRAAVAETIARSHTPVVVDETLADLALDEPPGTSTSGPAARRAPRPLSAFDRSGLVLAVGSMGKSYWGGLRLGWIRAPRGLIARLGAARASIDLGGPVLEQLIGARLLALGETVLGPRREALTDQRDALVGALGELIPEWQFEVPGGGLSLWVDIGLPVSSMLAVAAERHGVRVGAGPRFGVDGAFERWLRIPYMLPADVLVDATERVVAAFRAVVETRPAPQAAAPLV